ncbi:MAG: beta-CASP ribonuclease aCPSF1 [Candidatus Hadarchaeum sp.]|uniref:beta-CASP ribonuclease aCPSF1 n=1 Tax=Candidatus Hadarchaeum sp. TaxID=2883567 RepID=UPI003181DB3F
MAAEELLKEIKAAVKETPFADAVTNIDFEGPRVVLYCGNLDLLMENGEKIKELARKLRKRIILRPDPSILTDKTEAERKIRELVPAEANITDIIFSEDVGEVTIEAEKPGVAIGKGGALLREIMHKISWTPKVIRAPPIKSDIVRNIRLSMIYGGAERREILRRIGRRIHREQKAKDGWVRLTALGGAREVGRSCFLLQTPESKVMLDCGVNVASDDKAFPHLEAPEVRLPELDALILTHAHLDHCGFVPYLFKYGFDGPVYCTPPTRDLAVLLLIDYLDIAEREGKQLPFNKRDIGSFLSHCITLEYGDVTDIAPDIRITFHNAGHILGSSVVHIHIGDGLYNVVYTGDLKFDRTRLFSPAVYSFPRVETLIIDSTYGGSEDIQPYRTDAEKAFIQTVLETIKRGGKVLIPAFAVGRAQEIMVLLESARRSKIIDGIPVYLDGMIWEATAIHTAYPEYLSQELRELIFKEDENPFLSDMFTKVSGPDQRAEIIEGEPSVILSTAGMMAGGPVLEYFKHLAPDPKNTLIFVGYQGEGSMGRRIQKGWREIPMQGEKGKLEEVKVNMEVKTIEGFSGHSDRAQLLNYIRRLSPKPDRIVSIHGDDTKCTDFAAALHKLFRVETRAPLNLETIRLR